MGKQTRSAQPSKQFLHNQPEQAYGLYYGRKSRFSGYSYVLPPSFPVQTFTILKPTVRGDAVADARKTMAQIGKELLDESKRAVTHGDGKSSGRDLLSLLVKSNMNEKDEARMNDEDVLAQVPTFLVAGHETTSTATTWALFALTQHPDVQRKLRDELLSLPTENPSMDELNSLPYLDAFVRETLRVHAPVPATTRIAMRDGFIPLSEPVGGKDYVEVSKGQVIFINILALNRSRKLWGDDAKEFK